MTKWTIEGFQSNNSTGFSRHVSGTENRARLLLERLAARHLADDEITDATFGSRTDLKVSREKYFGQPTMLTTCGTAYYYVARESKPMPRRPKAKSSGLK